MSREASEIDELRIAIGRLRTLLENLVVRGLRACGADELAALRAFTDEFERTGAGHIASVLAELHGQIEKGQREAARTLLTAQTSVRMLERLLTLRAARGAYEMATQAAQEQDRDGRSEEEGD